MAKPKKSPLREDRMCNPMPGDETVPLKLSARERALILKHTFADDELTGPLRVAPTSREAPVYYFPLDDLEALAGYVAAEANHAKDKELQKELHRLFARNHETTGLLPAVRAMLEVAHLPVAVHPFILQSLATGVEKLGLNGRPRHIVEVGIPERQKRD